jgi:ABC-type transport system involved in multi-copper enzyme maturation permease subunit
MISNIIKTEWLKLKHYKAFWLLLSVTAISYPGINGIAYYAFKDSIDAKSQSGQLVKMLLGNPFAFPQSFHTTAYLSSFFTFIPAIVVIMLVTNEYLFKTHRQNIIDGWKKNTFIWGKFISVVLVTLIVTIFYLAVACFIGILATKEMSGVNVLEKANYIGLFSLQVFCQLSIAFLLGLLIRKAFIAYGIYIFYSFILENILSGFFRLKSKKWGVDYGHYLPFEISDRLIPLPPSLGKFNAADYELAVAAIDNHVVYTVLLTAFVWLISFYIFKKRDL